MSKIAEVFAGLKAKNKKGLIPFVTAGDPHPDLTVDVMHALVKGGADIIELRPILRPNGGRSRDSAFV